MNKIEFIKWLRGINLDIKNNGMGNTNMGLYSAKIISDKAFEIIDTLSKPSSKCSCEDVDLQGDIKIVNDVVHRKGEPCFIIDKTKPSVPSVDEMSVVTSEFIDKYFPKHECKERGQALVLHAEMLIAIHNLLGGKR